MSLYDLKTRQLQRGVVFGALFLVLTVGFQNCAPQQTNRNLASLSNSNSPAQTSAAGAANTTNTSSIVGLSGGSSSSGTSGSSNGGTNGGMTGAVAGGTPPYTYQWQLNNADIAAPLGQFSIYSDIADRYSKAGTYKVIIRDASGAKITSVEANVGITEIAGNCGGGTYTMLAGNNDPLKSMLPQLFQNARGTYLINSNNPDVNWMMSNPGYWGLYTYSIAAGASLEKRNLSCSLYIPRVNDPRQYTSSTSIFGQPQWKSTGAISVECHNQKWKVLANTCKWQHCTSTNTIFGNVNSCN